MKTFNDNAQRTWTVAVNVDAIKRVKTICQVDLLEVQDGRLLERLVNDPVLLVDVVYALCKPQADSENVSDSQFGQAMAGDAIDGATTALLGGLVDFFPSKRRGLLKQILSKMDTLMDMAVTAATRKLDSGDLEAQMQKAIDEMDEAASTTDSTTDNATGG